MKRLISLGVCLIVGAELLVLVVHDRRFVLVASGVALALVLLNIRRVVGHASDPAADSDPDDLGDSLRRWLATTETTIRWSGPPGRTGIGICVRCSRDGTKSLPAKGKPRTRWHFTSTGRMLFGAELWEWVNPEQRHAHW